MIKIKNTQKKQGIEELYYELTRIFYPQIAPMDADFRRKWCAMHTLPAVERP